MQPSPIKLRPNWHDIRFAMATAIAARSLCVRDQVGAIIVDLDNKVIGEGHNGPPRGFNHGNATCAQWCQRVTNARVAETLDGSEVRGLDPRYYDCPSLHAEANALMMSDRSLRSGGTIYVTSHICIGCAKLIANSGLATVHVQTELTSVHRNSEASYAFMFSCGLTVYANGSSWTRGIK